MRLTLRTLLAYLDNTLDSADAEILRQKLAESGFATQLVQRIRKNLVDPSLSAPPPAAVGPIHDANVIGEYLDSVLPVEQVSEIERACLELEPNLAEAAACHQILTMVLGKPANVSPELRDRIYNLPDREVERIAATSDRFSSLSMDDAPAESTAFQSNLEQSDDLPTIESAQTEVPQAASPLSAQSNAGHPVRPVGLTDSGVSDAPTRLRETGELDPVTSGGSAAGGGRRMSTEDRIYGGSIRPSRITPWLVTLALAAVLLFAIAQIFSPLLARKVADGDIDEVPTDVMVPPSEAPLMTPIETSTANSEAVVSPGDIPPSELMTNGGVVVDSAMDDMEPLPPPTATAPDDRGDMTAMEPLPSSTDRDPVMDDLLEPSETGTSRSGTSGSGTSGSEPLGAMQDIAPSDPVSGSGTDEATVPGESVDETESEPLPGLDAMTDAVDAGLTPPADPKTTAEIPPPASAVVVPDNTVVATVSGKDSMVLALGRDGQWARLGDMGEAMSGTPIVCAPKFRTVMKPRSGPKLELIGPAGARWLPIDQETFGLEVEFGRLLVTSKKPDSKLSIKLGGQPMELAFATEESVVAASIKHFRSPGVDPRQSNKRVELIGLLAAQGNVTLTHLGEQIELSTGEQWIKRGNSDGAVTAVGGVPSWISGVEGESAALNSSARDGLLSLTSADGPIERLLREATLFRRSEVAALAAQTLLFMGQSDVYFGSGGILSEAKQRQYWPEHFKALITNLDRGAEPAALLFQSMRKMDAANASDLYRLLVGFSEAQLSQGSDEQLVQWLDSESMAVRVLALENLDQITGTTLYFRAETDNQVRRAPGIKKWMARQQKGDIRWKPDN